MSVHLCTHIETCRMRGGMSSTSLRKQLKGAAYLPIFRMHDGNCASFSASLHNLTMAWFIYMGVKLFALSRLWYLTGEWGRIERTSRQFEILISAPPTAVFRTAMRQINFNTAEYYSERHKHFFLWNLCHSKMHLMFCGGHAKESKNLCKNKADFSFFLM